MITTRKMFNSKEEATKYFQDKYGAKLDTLEKFLKYKKFNIEESGFFYYYDESYLMIKLLDESDNPLLTAYYYDDSKNVKKLSVFDLIKEKPDDFKPEYIYNNMYKKGKKSSQLYPSLLLTYYCERQDYDSASKFVGQLLKEHGNTIFDTISYYTAEDLYSVERAYLYYLLLLYSSRKYTKEVLSPKYVERYLDALSQLSDKSPDGIPAALSNKSICYMHNYVIKEYKNRVGRARTKNIRAGNRSDDGGTNLLECSDGNIEHILSLFKPSPTEVGYYNSYVTRKDDWRFRDYAHYIDNHREEFEEVFKNYFYSKYGKGSKYTHLETRLYQFQQMVDVLGYTDISILDFVSDLPDKIAGAALKGLVGD